MRRFVKNNRTAASYMLLAVAVAATVAMGAKIKALAKAVSDAETIVTTAAANNKPDPDRLRQNLSQSRAVAETLKANNLFSPPLKPTHPVKQVIGIMGDEVLIEETWRRVGDWVSDAQITAIHPTYVTIRWQDNEKSFAPINRLIDPRDTRTVVRRTTTRKPEEQQEKRKKDNDKKPRKEKDPATVAKSKQLSDKTLAYKKAKEQLVDARKKATDETARQRIKQALATRKKAFQAAEKKSAPSKPKAPKKPKSPK